MKSYHKVSALDVTRGLVRFFEPEVIVEATPGLAARIGWGTGESYKREQRLISLSEFASVDTYGRTQFAAGISVSDIYAKLYQKEFKFEQRDKIDCAISDGSSRTDAFLDAVMGNFPIEKHLQFYSENFRRDFSPIELPNNAETLERILEGRLITPLWFTRHDLKRGHESNRDPTIFVFDPKDAQDVIDFWNYRLLRRWVFPINLHWFAECSDWIKTFIANNFRPLKGNPNGVMTHTALQFARSINQAKRTQLSSIIAGDVPSGSFFVSSTYNFNLATKRL